VATGKGKKQESDSTVKNLSKHHQKLTDFGFVPGDATTFKSILNVYDKGGEVLGFVVGYSGEVSSDVYRVADLVHRVADLVTLD
jgi:esterase/lipase superfamily enzyme